MKKRMTAVLLILSLICVCLPLFSAKTQAATRYDVTKYGANGSDSADDYYGIQGALDEATRTSSPIEVYVPAGTYYIQYNLEIYSDTTLTLASGATIVSRVAGNPMIYGAHTDASGNLCRYAQSGCKHGGYSQVCNVVIQGGTWDCNASYNYGFDGICIRHGSNITIQNTTIKHCSNHSLNLSGVNGALVSGVTFQDAVAYAGASAADLKTKEAIHLDYCNKSNENSDRSYPYDDSSSRNITVTGCVFNNVYAGVGTHHSANGYRGGPITITANTVKNVTSYFVYGCNYDNLTVSSNTITNTGALCSIKNSSATISGNVVSCSGKEDTHAIYIQESTTAAISNNALTGATLSGIGIVGGSTVTATGNTIASPLSHGMKVDSNSKLTATSNTITNPGGCGFYVDYATLNASSNKITNAANHAVYAKNKAVVDFTENTINKTTKRSIADDGTASRVTASKNWTKVDGKWYLLKDASAYATGWQKVNGKWYYFNTDGTQKTGWLKDGGKWYYLNDYMVTGTQTIGGKKYIFNSSGVWQEDTGKSGWQKESGKWYYYQSGKVSTGWKKVSGVYYYFDTKGVMQTGWVKSGGKWYYLKSSGAMATGWQQVSGKWYYFNTSGAMVTGWTKVGSKWYYMNASGAMQTGWLKDGGKWYYLDTSGAMATGWVKVSGTWYYMNGSGVMLTGKQTIGGKEYTFSSGGAWIK